MMYPSWYERTEVLTAMLPFLYNREFYSGVPKHYHKGQRLGMLHLVNSIQSLKRAIEKERLSENERNFFTSVASFKKIPLKITSEWFENYIDNIASYDFFLDIDSIDHKDMSYCFISCKIIKEFFDSLRVPYYLRFSGKGFHFVIPHKFFDFNNFEKGSEVYKIYSDIATYLYISHSELIDTKLYESHRKIKVPYSLSLYEGHEFVCCPINSNYEFYNFKLYNYTAENVLRKIYGRKQKLFNPEGSVQRLLEVTHGSTCKL